MGGSQHPSIVPACALALTSCSAAAAAPSQQAKLDVPPRPCLCWLCARAVLQLLAGHTNLLSQLPSPVPEASEQGVVLPHPRRFAGVAMLRYGDLSSSQIAMLAVALQAYGNRPFGGKLLKASCRLGGLPGRGKEVCVCGRQGLPGRPSAAGRGQLVWALPRRAGRRQRGRARSAPDVVAAAGLLPSQVLLERTAHLPVEQFEVSSTPCPLLRPCPPCRAEATLRCVVSLALLAFAARKLVPPLPNVPLLHFFSPLQPRQLLSVVCAAGAGGVLASQVRPTPAFHPAYPPGWM